MPPAVMTGTHGWTDPESDRGTRLAASVALYALAAGAVWSPPLVQLAEVALFVILVAQVYAHPSVFARSPFFWVTAGFVLYVILRGLIAGVIESPDLSALHFEGIRRWVKAGPLPVLCVAVAFALIGDRRVHIRRVFALFVIVFAVDLLLKLEPDRLWAALNPEYSSPGLEFGKRGRRYIFGLHFAFTSLLYALTIAGLLALGIGACLEHRRRRVWCVVLGGTCGILLIFFLVTLIAGGARTSWLATAAGVAVMLLCLAFYLRGRLIAVVRAQPMIPAAVVFGLGLVFVVFGSVFGHGIVDRISSFGDTPAAAIEVVTGERTVESLPRGPIGDRVAYYAFGLERLRERPLAGYGPGRPRHLVYEYDAPYQIDDRNTHVHSQYLDILLRFGVIGFVLIMSVFVLALRGAVSGWSRRLVGGDYLLFMIGALTIYAIWSLSDQRFTNFTMVTVVSLILGSGASFLFSVGVNRKTERGVDRVNRENPSLTVEGDK